MMAQGETTRLVLPGPPEWLGIIAIGLLAVALGLAAIFVMRDMTRRGQRAWPCGVLIIAAPLVGLLIGLRCGTTGPLRRSPDTPRSYTDSLAMYCASRC